jgi:aspartyl-tRNA(Asn)/glutamyl-tRNA(Gln) amidotransferase subunit B
MKTFFPIIGLEVHVELATKSKMFCGCPAEHFGIAPNTHTCPVCLGLPGALPVPNKKAVEWTIMLGLALGCKISSVSKFDRKNYFYPDLPKGYQISQYDQPLCVDGSLLIGEEKSNKSIRISRVHLEEDTGKLQHQNETTLVDFNRSGVPLVEIVTEPDFRSIEEVDRYLKKLQRIVRYLGISGADMEKGSMRLEPSISIAVQETGNKKQETNLSKLPEYRVELKNINSFRFARKALEYEIKRQTEILEQGETPAQQTRGWSETKNATVLQREKEEANDYRYFPEPDIPPMRFTKSQIADLKLHIPELPDVKIARFQKDYGLSQYSSDILAEDKAVADYFETAVGLSPEMTNDIANWIINRRIDINSVLPAQLIIQLKTSQRSSQIDEEELEKIVRRVLQENPKALEEYRKGKLGVIGFLIGSVAKIDPKIDRVQIRRSLERILSTS